MPIGSWGGYSPLTIDSEVLAVAPKSVQQLWGKVTTVQAQVREARDLLTTLEADAANAPTNDEQAARAAVAAGKPVPEPTVMATQEAADQQQRTVKALINHADDVEANFMNALNGHRGEMVAGFQTQATQALEDALAALSAAGDAVERFSKVGALWSWARSEDGGNPSTFAYHLPRTNGQDVTALIDSCALAIDRAHPDEVLAAEAEALAAWQASRGRATADGLLVDDYSGRRAAMQMAGE